MLLTDVTNFAKSIKVYNFNQKSNVSFNHISKDSKIIKKYSIFAISKNIKKKKLYIIEAINNGAVAIITDQLIKNIKVTQFIVNDINEIVFNIIKKLKPNKPLNSISITGTNGKTSVVSYISQIYFYNNIKTKTYGTLGYFVNLKKRYNSQLTTPVLKFYNKLVSQQIKIYIIIFLKHLVIQLIKIDLKIFI